MVKQKGEWGSYYYQGLRKGKKNWALEVLHDINQAIPTFDELFDEETFYVFAFCVVIASIILVIFLAKVVGIKIKEHPLEVGRDWGEPRPANPFSFPVKHKMNRYRE